MIMQTFIPYLDFFKSLNCLDSPRLGKQRVEAMQILKALENPGTSRWENHPATVMWCDNLDALEQYHDIAIIIWKSRGYKNNLPFKKYKPTMSEGSFIDAKFPMPWWWGDYYIHSSHRANLLRKDPKWYGQFAWKEKPIDGYVWPVTHGLFKIIAANDRGKRTTIETYRNVEKKEV